MLAGSGRIGAASWLAGEGGGEQKEVLAEGGLEGVVGGWWGDEWERRREASQTDTTEWRSV